MKSNRRRETVSEPSRANGRTQYLPINYLLPKLLPGAAAPPPNPNPERTLDADCTKTARAPRLHTPIINGTHLQAENGKTARRRSDHRKGC